MGLADILVKHGVLNQTAAVDARGRSKAGGRTLAAELLASGAVNERELYRAMSEQYSIPLGTVDGVLENLDRKLLFSLPRPFLKHEQMLPIRRVGNAIEVAITNPNGDYSDIGRATEAVEVRPLLIAPSDLRRIWSIVELTPHALVASGISEEEILGDADFESRMVALFEAILLDAIGTRTSDVHLEIFDGRVRVRYRIDGGLHDIRRFELSREDLRGVVNVIKISANMDITERRLPQGGRMRRRAGAEVYDLRVQTQPALHGEHVVIRLLHQDDHLLGIEDLGFTDVDAASYRRLLGSPQGMVLVVGPTGSGKSTTLYAGLSVLAADSSRKVITVEDPIEYAIEGVQQTQVHPAIGFAFADAMRAFVREDPDVILVGEIRDNETAMEAIRASQTGHLVLSTLHCNDAVDAVQRLLDLQMHPNSIASELVAVVAQRLVRRVCTHCRQPAEPDEAILGELFPTGMPENFQCWAGLGCDFCNDRGTHGRIATLEFLLVDEEIRRGISRGLTVDELRHLARDSGMKPIRAHLLELVLSGISPLSEVPRALTAEQMAPNLAYRTAVGSSSPAHD